MPVNITAEHGQLGEGRAEYGQRVFEPSSERLGREYGKGFSIMNLRYFVATWNIEEKIGGELKLTDGNYKCPQYGRMTLHFAESGLCWD